MRQRVCGDDDASTHPLIQPQRSLIDAAGNLG